MTAICLTWFIVWNYFISIADDILIFSGIGCKRLGPFTSVPGHVLCICKATSIFTNAAMTEEGGTFLHKEK